MAIWIDSSSKLTALAEQLCQKADLQQLILAIDTEFIREKTYFPELCLVQMAFEEQAFLIDPLILQEGIKCLKPILKAKNILKVFHSARQDLEIFWHLFEDIPAPIYDTQVAAMVCGYGESVSYQGLVESLLKRSLDKTSRLSNWKNRPLSESQVSYAVNDVTNLLKIYHLLEQKVHAMGRSDWFQTETADLLNPDLYRPNPERAWEKIKTKNLKSRSIYALKRLAYERECEAMKLDIPKSYLIKNEVLIEMAQLLPEKSEDIRKIRGAVIPLQYKAFYQKLFSICGEVKKAPLHGYDCSLQPEEERQALPEDLINMLQLWLKITSERKKTAARLIAVKEDIETLVAYMMGYGPDQKEVKLLQGWRYEIFGHCAVNIIQGKVALSWDGERIQMLERI